MGYQLDGCEITLWQADTVLAAIAEHLAQPRKPPLAVASANLDHLHHFGTKGPSRTAVDFRHRSLRWVNLLDGAPLLLKARTDTGVRWPRLAGSDLLPVILAHAEREGASVGFLGGTVTMHQDLARALTSAFPKLTVRGYWAPEREELTDENAMGALAAEIRAADVDVLVVGLGKPRQEIWIARHGVASGARVLLAFGASADFLAGHAQRAPEAVRDAGLEWAWRLAREPTRLARRYLIQGPPALWRMLRIDTGVEPAPTESESVDNAAEPLGVVIVTHNNALQIAGLLSSLPGAARDLPIEVVVVDNGSSDGTAAVVAGFERVRFVAAENLGYAAGINRGRRELDANRRALVVLNPDLVLAPESLRELFLAVTDPDVGVAIPRIIDPAGHTFHSLRREASVLRGAGEALFGARWPNRPAWLADTLRRPTDYTTSRSVEWASGAALVISSACDQEVGEWDERFFLYSEEVDLARRVRGAGYRITYVPSAVVTHVGGASGSSPQLAALEAVNRVRDFESGHGLVGSTLYRLMVLGRHLLRSWKPEERYVAAVLLDRSRWSGLPGADRAVNAPEPPGDSPPPGPGRPAGSVIIPAHNEETTIRRLLSGLATGLGDADLDVVVVCNGCVDRTAAVAREAMARLRLPGRVVEIDTASKAAALRAGDRLAIGSHRVYLDADVEVSGRAVRAVLVALDDGALAARPPLRYDTWSATAPVKAFYRARARTPELMNALWGAGFYAVSAQGRQRWDEFPDDCPDDLFVDRHFARHEVVVVPGDPVTVRPPRTVSALVRTLRRVYRRQGHAAVHAAVPDAALPARRSSVGSLVRANHSDTSQLVDLGVYVVLAALGRVDRSAGGSRWERDETSRS